jgi:hypothetical protein
MPADRSWQPGFERARRGRRGRTVKITVARHRLRRARSARKTTAPAWRRAFRERLFEPFVTGNRAVSAWPSTARSPALTAETWCST